ncbi:MAG: hypothetical protein HY682_11790 [Chloroflexi bacterium]|nr:hypothetical protein [Chloroflexota bacterium]
MTRKMVLFPTMGLIGLAIIAAGVFAAYGKWGGTGEQPLSAGMPVPGFEGTVDETDDGSVPSLKVPAIGHEDVPEMVVVPEG